MANTEEWRNQRRNARTLSPAGKMPSNWDTKSNAWKASFTQAEKLSLLNGEFLWSPEAEEHGDWNTYNNYFCRCPLCSRTNAQRKANERAKKTGPTTNGPEIY